MGYSTYKPEWQVTTPVRIPSFNPLIREDVELDSYTVIVADYDQQNQKTGEHEELCVTHASLLRWYQKNLMPYGGSIQYEVFPGTKSGVVVKCTLEKIITKEEADMLRNLGRPAFPNNTVHIESLGEASCDNCSTQIAKKHLANTAENRSFDRALIRYLSLNLETLGTTNLYSSSEELGVPVQKENSEPVPAPVPLEPKAEQASAGKPAFMPPPVPDGKPSAGSVFNPEPIAVDKPKERPAFMPTPIQDASASLPEVPSSEAKSDATKSSNEKMSQKPKWYQPQSVNAPKADRIASGASTKSQLRPMSGKAAPFQGTNRKLSAEEKKAEDEDMVLRYKDDREEAARLTYSPEDYKNLMDCEFTFMGSEFNGVPIRDMVNGIVRGNGDMIHAVHSYVLSKPRQTDQIPVWKCLISYLTKNNMIAFYRTGKFFVCNKT